MGESEGHTKTPGVSLPAAYGRVQTAAGGGPVSRTAGRRRLHTTGSPTPSLTRRRSGRMSQRRDSTSQESSVGRRDPDPFVSI